MVLVYPSTLFLRTNYDRFDTNCRILVYLFDFLQIDILSLMAIDGLKVVLLSKISTR